MSNRNRKRANSGELNGKDIKEESHKNKPKNKKFKNDEEIGEALYCIKCDISFLSLSDHMKDYHDNFDFIIKVLCGLFIDIKNTYNRGEILVGFFFSLNLLICIF